MSKRASVYLRCSLVHRAYSLTALKRGSFFLSIFLFLFLFLGPEINVAGARDHAG
jgi:hypothetical protein